MLSKSKSIFKNACIFSKNTSSLHKHTYFIYSHPPIESKQVDKIRSKRGKVPRSSPDFKIKNDVKQHLEAVEAESMPLEIQTNFLSESVRKYLELGRAIPGFQFFHTWFYLIINIWYFVGYSSVKQPPSSSKSSSSYCFFFLLCFFWAYISCVYLKA